MKSTTED